MKKLTTDQISALNSLLIQQYDLKFEAFRDEVVDHMACEIEALLEQNVDYTTASKRILAKWHFELRPILGEKGIPACIVKQVWRKDALLYVCFILLIVASWALGNYSGFDFKPNPWISLGCVVLGFLFSILVQKRFYKQTNYEMQFYMQALGSVMLVNIISMTLGMMLIRSDFEQSFGLSAYSFFVLALHLLILNVFFGSRVLHHHKVNRVQL